MVMDQRWIFCIFEWMFLCISASEPGRRCLFLASQRNNNIGKAGVVRGSVQICAHTQCCVGFFHLIDAQLVADLQGCSPFKDSPCPNETCVESVRLENGFTCLCNADFCNGNITRNPEKLQLSPHLSAGSVIGVTVSLIVLIILIAVALRRPFFNNYGEKLRPSPESSVTAICVNDLITDVDMANFELHQVLGRGHFATVWHGRYRGSTVAVKIFPLGCKREFCSEKEVYEMPLMEHSGIVNFLGAMRKRRESGGDEWILLLELAVCGSLHSFLSDNTSDWMTSLKLAQSLSEGLAYLHSDIYKHGVHKPPVAHRDLSSSNVLVRADGSCALSDFGCSTIAYSWKGNTELMIRVGTLRYMSPEVMEGSVILSSGLYLLQADVYALGLLLWEIWTRCSDVYGGSSVPEHRLPYETELGSSLSLESLVFYVCNLCKRPFIPEQWEQFPQGFSLQETIIECWEDEPDARLSAERAADRFLSLQPCFSI